MAQLSAVYPVRLEVRDLCAACLFYIDLSIVLGVGGLGGGLFFLLLVCGALGLVFVFFLFLFLASSSFLLSSGVFSAFGVFFGGGVLSGVGTGVTIGSTVGAVSMTKVASASALFAHPHAAAIPINASTSAAALLQNLFIIAKV